MNSFLSSLTVRQRLAAGFALILLILVGLAVTGLIEVARVDKALDENARKSSVIQRYAINFRGSAHDRAIAIRDVAASATPEELRREIADIERLTAFYAESARPLDKLLAEDRTIRPEVASLAAAIKEVEGRTLPLISKVIELRTAGQREEA